ncbi:MAG: AraC family transcriptional regulator [Verrucomicrobiota bacterium]|jgi:AraC-like DNA-binding protein
MEMAGKGNRMIRYGRSGDAPALIGEVPVIGRRIVRRLARKALPAHQMDNFEITLLLDGSLTWLINGELLPQQPRELLITRPHDRLASPGDSLSCSDAYFLQVDLSPRSGSSWPEEELRRWRDLLFELGGEPLRSSPAGVAELMEEMLREHRLADAYSAVRCRFLLGELLIKLGRSLRPASDSGRERILGFLRRRLAEDFDIAAMAAALGGSPARLREECRRLFNRSPVELVREYRLAQARRLIAAGRLGIAEVALVCGFSSPQYFAQVFTRFTGVCPRDYRSALAQGSGRLLIDHKRITQFLDGHFSPD